MKTKIEIVKVSVTREHIRKGRPRDAELCPIALAIGERFPDADYLTVTGQAISVRPTGFGETAFIRTPTRAAEFVSNFDEGRDVAPFEFEFELVVSRSLF